MPIPAIELGYFTARTGLRGASTVRSCQEIHCAFNAHLYPKFERSSLENARNTPVYLRIFTLRTSKFRANLSGNCTVYFLTVPKQPTSKVRMD
jgi:hypothetical protein